MHPREIQLAAWAIRVSCNRHDVRLPESVSGIQLVRAAQDLGLLSKVKVKDLTAEEAKRIAAAFVAMGGDKKEPPTQTPA